MLDYFKDLLISHIVGSQLYPLVMVLTTLSMTKLCLILLIIVSLVWLTREWKGR